MKRILLGSLMAVALAALFPAASLAGQTSPQMISSDPENGEVFHDSAPQEVSITFSEPLDDTSEIVVKDECGRRIDHGSTDVSLNEMSVDLHLTPAGKHFVSYEAVGLAGATGTTEGHFGYEVHVGPACDGSKHEHNGNGNGKGSHEGHKKNGEHGGSGHDGSGHETSTHEGSGHDGTDHGSGHGATGGHSGTHDAGQGNGHGKHDSGGGTGGGVQAAPPPSAIGNGPTVAALGRIETGAILLALASCAGIGLAGGWMMRLASRPRH